ncbi:MAG TPA: DnaB-like helicase C-terminal domain-containing protein [Polyangiaceae bacterium]
MKQPDEADQLKAGTLPSDPKANVRPLSLQVPRVHTVLDLLRASEAKLHLKADELRCTTTHYALDRITGGFRPGFTWLFGADTSFGKSSFLVAIADENIRAGKRVLIVSSEDTEDIYGDRLMVRRAGVNAMRYRDGQLTFEEHQNVATALSNAEKVPVYVDARRFPVEDLAGHLAKIIAEHKIDLVAFDYVQEFRTKRHHQDERIKFREIASVLRHVTKDAKIAGIIFSQLTLDDKTVIPNRRNIRDCRDMAHGAEVILIGFEPKENVMSGTRLVASAGRKCVFVDKVKNGPRGRVVEMAWSSYSACFDTVTRTTKLDDYYRDEQKREQETTIGDWE